MAKMSLIIAGLTILVSSCATKVSSNFKDDPLHMAAGSGDIEEAALLLEQGADINEIRHSETPLSLASIKNRIEMAQYLISQGADINKGNSLYEAVYHENYELAKILLENGANQVNPNGYHKFATIINNNDKLDKEQKVEMVKYISGKIEISPLILSHVEDSNDYDFYIKELNLNLVNPPSDDPMSLLHKAALSMKPELVNAALKNGIDVNTPDMNGTTPIVYAAMAYGTSIDWKEPIIENDNEAKVKTIGDHPFYFDPRSVQRNNTMTVAALLDAEADLNIQNKYGWNVAHFAAAKKPAGLMGILIENGVELEALTNQGRSVYDIAVINNNEPVKELLEETIEAK